MPIHVLTCALRHHEWRAIYGGPFGYLRADNDGNFQVCARCGKRRYSQRRHVEAVQKLQNRQDTVDLHLQTLQIEVDGLTKALMDLQRELERESPA